LNACYTDVVERLGLPRHTCPAFVGRGVEGNLFTITEFVEANLQLGDDYTSTVRLYVMPNGCKAHGSDFILGMAWMRTIGRYTFDPLGKSMEFTHRHRRVVLRARPWWRLG
jgi:hypothetical protein